MNAPPSIVVQRNPLRPAEREVHEGREGERLIDWLVEHYPAGFGRPIVVERNGERVEFEACDFVLAAGDVVAIRVNPGGPIALGPIIVTALITAAITAAFTLAINMIFGKPRAPKSHDMPAPDPIYSISGAQNAARLGDPIPALYGHIITSPDYGSQPYTFFHDNNQYLDQILVLGWGEFDLHDVRIGETPVSALEGNAVEYWLFGPDDHGSTIGTIEAATGVLENVVTSPEVGDQELTGLAPSAGGDFVEFVLGATFTAPETIVFDDPSGPDPGTFTHVQIVGTVHNNGTFELAGADAAGIEVTGGIEDEASLHPVTFRYYSDPAALGVGPFVTCKPGVAGNLLIADFVWPQGLYEVDETTGALAFATVEFTIEYQKIDDDGAALGGWMAHNAVETRNTNTPIRISYEIPVAPGRYRVRVFRATPAPTSARQVSAFVWTALKFSLVPAPAPVYGNVSLLVVRVRATNGIASAASTRISAEITRRLPVLGSGPLVASTSPADAFCDIYTNADYGAKRPLAEVDVAELARLVEHWGGLAHFNAGFAQRSTVWEALRLSVQTAGASPLPLGQLMSVAQDGVRAIRTQLFSDANIVRGSLGIGYNFDRPGDYDGFRVEYRDPDSWNALAVTYPPGALDADPVELFGCTDEATAEGFARLLWNKRLMQRKTARFDTELEGLIPRLGDRVAIASSLPRWSKAGVVVAALGLVLKLDDAIDWSGSGHLIVLRSQTGEPSDPIAVAPGAGPFDLVLAEVPPFPLFGTGSQEPTHYAFGPSTSLVRDFTIANIEHRGGVRVGIEAVVYDPAVFAETLPWLEDPI